MSSCIWFVYTAYSTAFLAHLAHIQLETVQIYIKADMAKVMPKASLKAVCSDRAVRMRDELKRSFRCRYCGMSIPALAAKLWKAMAIPSSSTSVLENVLTKRPVKKPAKKKKNVSI